MRCEQHNSNNSNGDSNESVYKIHLLGWFEINCSLTISFQVAAKFAAFKVFEGFLNSRKNSILRSEFSNSVTSSKVLVK